VRAAGGRAVIWGAGSKGVAFLSALGDRGLVDAAVDINPFKRGMFMAGTGHCIVAPEQLKAAPPDLVVAMNPVYRNEITATLRSLDLDPVLEAL
jgi:threonine dehydrogenase-like Zn-dependent dehydrogenase